MARVKFNKLLTQTDALRGDVDTIYFTTDTQCLVMGGKVYGIGNSRLFIGSQLEYEVKAASGQIPFGTIVIINDENTPDIPSDSSETTSILGMAILGKMILGQE